MCRTLALLGKIEDVEATRHVKLFLFYALYYARREILLKWKQPTPPTVNSWIAAVNSVLPLYKLTYENRNCQKNVIRYGHSGSRPMARHLMVTNAYSM